MPAPAAVARVTRPRPQAEDHEGGFIHDRPGSSEAMKTPSTFLIIEVK